MFSISGVRMRVGASVCPGAPWVCPPSTRAGEGVGRRGWHSNRSSVHCHNCLDFTPEDPKNLSVPEKSMSRNIWKGSEVILSHRSLNKFSKFPEALIANFILFNFRDSKLEYVDKFSEFFI